MAEVSRHTFRMDWDFKPRPEDEDNRRVTVEIAFDFVKGSPEVPPAYSHGGLPADPDEVDFISAHAVVDGKLVPLDKADEAELFADQFVYDKCVDVARNGG